MGRARMTLLGFGALLALLVAGCGGSSVPTPPKTLSIATKHGLSYTLQITGSGDGTCTNSTYRVVVRGHPPILQRSHLCGRAIVAGHPLLIQTPTSAEAILVDVPSTGCARVLARQKAAAFTPLVSRCAAGVPAFRATILPRSRHLTLQGVRHTPVINFPRHLCQVGLCITALTAP